MSMKIVQVVPRLESGGVERGAIEVASSLVAAGHEAVLISQGGQLVDEVERDPSEVPFAHMALLEDLEEYAGRASARTRHERARLT